MGNKFKILLVEDSHALAAVYKGYLRDENCDVVHVDDGKSAIDALQKQKFDIVLLDLALPDTNGLELLKYMQENNMLITVIVISALGSFENADAAMHYGVFDFITKPFNADRLKTAVKNATKEDSWVYGQYNISGDKSAITDAKEPAVVDAQMLLQLEKDVGTERAIDVVKIFAAETRKRVTNMEQSLLDDDYDALIKEVTIIKSSSATYGLCKMEALCALVEKSFIDEDYDAMAKGVSSLLDVSRISIDEIIYYYDLGNTEELEDKNKEVLLVEDSESLAAVYQGYLHDEEYNITHVNNCYGAIESLKAKDFDVVLLDLELPDSSGLNVMEFINSHNLPATIIVITGLGSFRNADIAMKHGAFDFLTKPFNAERLKSSLNNAVQQDKWLYGEYNIELNKGQELLEQELDIIDENLFSELEAELGIHQLVMILKMFMNETKTRLKNLLAASRISDYEWMGKEIHSLKSMAGTYGAMQLHQKCVFIDMAYKNEDYETVNEEINRAVELGYNTLFELEGYCESNATLDVVNG